MSIDIVTPSASPVPPGERPQPWYAGYVDQAEISPERDLPLPPELADDVYSPLHEVVAELREHFNTYWEERMNAIRESGGMVVANKSRLKKDEQYQLDKRKDSVGEIGIYDIHDRRKAFMAEARFFHAVVSTVNASNREEDLNNIVVFFDVDETIGQIPTYGRPELEIPGLTDVDYETLQPEQRQQLREAHGKAQYEDMIFRPAFALTVNYLMEKYGYNVQRLQFGLLTSHKQKALIQYLLPRLQQACPGAFLEDGHGDNIISCNDSRIAAKLGRDVATLIEQPEEKDESGKPVHVPLSALVRSYPIARRALRLRHRRARKTSFQETKLVIIADRVTEANNEIDNNTTIVLVDDWRSMEIIHDRDPQWKSVKVHRAKSRFFVPGNFYYDYPENEMA